jgi:hypothetical protein
MYEEYDKRRNPKWGHLLSHKKYMWADSDMDQRVTDNTAKEAFKNAIFRNSSLNAFVRRATTILLDFLFKNQSMSPLLRALSHAINHDKFEQKMKIRWKVFQSQGLVEKILERLKTEVGNDKRYTHLLPILKMRQRKRRIPITTQQINRLAAMSAIISNDQILFDHDPMYRSILRDTDLSDAMEEKYPSSDEKKENPSSSESWVRSHFSFFLFGPLTFRLNLKSDRRRIPDLRSRL